MFYTTLVAYPKDGLHMQAPWMKIWISSYYEVFTVSIDGGFNITGRVLVSTECLTAHLHRTRLEPTRVSVTTSDYLMSYTPKIEECLENLDHSFGTAKCLLIFQSVH